MEERGANRGEGSVCRVTLLSTLGSPPPQRPELGGAGWAHSAGSTVLSSDCRPTGSLATERKADQNFTTAEASRGAQHSLPPPRGGGGSNLTSNPEKQLNSYSRFLVAAAAPSRPGRAAHATSALGAQSRPGSKFSQVTKNLKVWLQYRPAHDC